MVRDASSELRRACWRSLKQNCYGRWDLGLPQHPRQQGWINDLDAPSLSGQREVQDSAISRESDGYCFVGCSWSSTCWFHTFRFTNKCICLSETWRNSRQSFGKRDQHVGRVLLLHSNERPHRAVETANLLTFWCWEILPYPPHRPNLHRRAFICSKRSKSTSEVSTSTPVKIFKMK